MPKNRFDRPDEMSQTTPGYQLKKDGTETLNVSDGLSSGASRPDGVEGVEWSEETASNLPKNKKAVEGAKKKKNSVEGVKKSDIQKEYDELKKKKRIGREEVDKATETLKEYQAGKEILDMRIRSNNEWWKIHQWREVGKPHNPTDPMPSSAWLFNSIANKHADIMDNFPSPNVLARAEDDKTDAKILSKVIPCVLEYNDFEQVYSDAMWRKEINGSAIFSVVWDVDEDDVKIRNINPLSMYWEPGIDDIQKSRNVFIVEWQSNEVLEEQYPQLRGKLGGQGITIKDYVNEDNINHAKDSVVVHWYYKRSGILHYCIYVDGEVLFATENEPDEYPLGLYDDGDYPFVFDTCYPQENSPFGFGQVDIGKDPQMFVDKLSSVILKNAIIGSRPRYIVADSAGINVDEFSDATKDIVHCAASRISTDMIMPIQYNGLQGNYMNLMEYKVNELKETSGNRDVNQGSSSGGVTSGTAITALQESGNKLSRDQLKSTYRAFSKICYLIIERMRQFYTEPRYFRITGDSGEDVYVSYDNSNISNVPITDEFQGEIGTREPIFDIKVSAQRSNPFQKEVQNQRAQELFAAGYFNPQNADMALAAIDMMEFEGKEEVRRRIQENGGMYQQIQQLQEQVTQLGQMYMGQQQAITDATGGMQGGAV